MSHITEGGSESLWIPFDLIVVVIIDETQNKRSREEISSDEAPETSEENLNPEKKEKMEYENVEHIVRKELKRISRDVCILFVLLPPIASLTIKYITIPHK